MNNLKVALVGATGLVGNVMLKVLEEFHFKNIELLPVASEKSIGKTIEFAGKKVTVIGIGEAVAQKPQFAIFSAGSSISLAYAPKFAEQGTFVIDNSSAWRKYKEVPLVVPEINANIINANTKIIANPNCSTIQFVLALAPLHKAYHTKRVVISTYQSVTGTGVKAVKQLKDEQQNIVGEKVYPHTIHENLLPHGGDFQEDGYTTEEQKLIDETRKILADNNIQLTATVVRVPVIGGHSESVNIEFEKDFELPDVYKLLNEMPGIKVLDSPKEFVYPMPLHAKDKNEVFVGRIRRDFSQKNSLNLWVVADNLRKGAATNAIQIMQYIVEASLIKN